MPGLCIEIVLPIPGVQPSLAPHFPAVTKPCPGFLRWQSVAVAYTWVSGRVLRAITTTDLTVRKGLTRNEAFLSSPSLPFPVLSVSRIGMASSTAKVVAEYAKSGRSSCKGCSKAISAGSLRLGLSTKDPRGFDMTRWMHLDCFPTKRKLFASAEDIKGFTSLKSADQKAVKKLEEVAASAAAGGELLLEETNASDEGNEKTVKTPKVRKSVEDGAVESEETSLKKQKLFVTEGERKEIVFSISDVKDTYKDAKLSPKWKAFQTIIFREQGDDLHDSEKIAAFDFDGCLVNTSVRRVGADAWSLLYPSIPEKLQSLYDSGYKLIVFTNESNIERWKNKRQQAVDSKLGRLDNFLKRVMVPMQVFIACGLGKGKEDPEDPFRKPNVGMWRIMEKYFNSGIPIDMNQSFYVGDAAGRIDDHSDADIKFAKRIGLAFHVPEKYFSG